MSRKRRKLWTVPNGVEPTEFERRMMSAEESGAEVPPRNLIKTEEQREGIRLSGIVNTGVLDEVASKIHAGMSTEELFTIILLLMAPFRLRFTTKAFLKAFAQA